MITDLMYGVFSCGVVYCCGVEFCSLQMSFEDDESRENAAAVRL